MGNEGVGVEQRHEVTVTVSGAVGVGKSAIYGEIVTALQAIGVPVEHADPQAWQSECRMTHADWQESIDLYRPTVTMVEALSRPDLLSSGKDREAIALIVDPEAWTDVSRNWGEWPKRREASLAKAELILALPNSDGNPK